jgi:phosphoribosylpyrophosphate synthetase
MDGLRYFRESERLRKQNRENEALYKRYEVMSKDQEMVKRAEEVARARHEAIVKQRIEHDQQQGKPILKRL